jgi:hypothetical protein
MGMGATGPALRFAIIPGGGDEMLASRLLSQDPSEGFVSEAEGGPRRRWLFFRDFPSQ